MPAILLAGCVVSVRKSCLNPKPHVAFHLGAEGDDERVWRVIIYVEDEVPGVDRLRVGDMLAVAGVLNIHPATDSQKRRPLAFEVVGRQLLFLRLRSARAAA